MDLGSIFLLLALLILVAVFIARPLLEHKAVGVSEEEQTLSALLARRDRVLDALQELDFDFKLGKIPELDYPAQRTNLLQQGAEVLKKLDTLQAHPTQATDVLEFAIAARKAQSVAIKENGSPPSNVVRHPDDDIESLIAARRRQRKTKSAGFCPQCGHPIQTNDKFCSKCGTTLSKR
jgi:NADH pyrophosphatase NudC (nudix superfamily)